MSQFDKLKDWVLNYIHPVYTGFVEELGTKLSTLRLISHLLSEGKRNQEQICDIFWFFWMLTLGLIEWDWNRLWILRIGMEFFNRKQRHRFPYGLIWKYVRGKKIHLKNGLHQGS